MLTDPQSVTINAVATSLPRTQMSATANVYTSVDGNTAMTVKQTASKTRFRREIRLSNKKVAADPISAVNKEIGASIYLVIDEPRAGYTDAELAFFIEGLRAWLVSANYNRVLGGEY